MNIIQWDNGWQTVEQNIIQWDKGWQIEHYSGLTNWTLFSEIRVDKLNIIQWDNGWQTVEHKTLFSEIRVDKLLLRQIEHYSVR